MTQAVIDNPLLMGRLLQKLREETNPQLLGEATAEYLSQVSGHPVTWIGLYDRRDHTLRTIASISPGSRRLFAQEPIVLEAGEPLEQVVIERRLLTLPDISSEARAGRLGQLIKTGLRGALVLPIRHREICYGVALLGSDQWGMTLAPAMRNLLAIVLGQLGTALHHIEDQQQQQRQKRPDEPLLRLLDELRSLSGLADRLDRVTVETQQFIRPTRTSLYWYAAERRCFERRHSQPPSASLGRAKDSQSSELSAAEHEGFYRALQADRFLSVSDSQSSVGAEVSHGLLTQLDARSALIAPINLQGLRGFIAVTGQQPRMWTPEEKAYLQGVSQLVALLAPLSDIEQEIGQAKGDHLILAELSQAINGDDDWASLLSLAADRLFTRLRVERLILISPGESGGESGFAIAGQRQLGRRRAISTSFGPLSHLDRPLIGQGPVCIEDIQADLRLMGWRSALESGEVRSAMLSRMSAEGTSEGILIVSHESPRSWSHADQDLLRNVAYQLGSVLRQRLLSQHLTEQQTLNQALQWGLTASQQERQPDRLDWLMIQAIAQMLQSPVVALLTWTNAGAAVELGALATNGGSYAFPTVPVIPSEDRLLNQVLQSDGWLQPHRDTLPEQTRSWLGAGNGRLLITALRGASEAEVQGAILVLDQPDRAWSERQLSLANILVRQMAWSRRTLTQLTRLQTLYHNHELLNWYKQFWLQEVQRQLSQAASRSGESAHEELLETLSPLIAQESRCLSYHSQRMNLTRFLKRSIERIDPLLRQRQLWHKVHGGDPSYRVQGDLSKLEAIVYEVLSIACDRCAPGSRLDIWCQLLEDQKLQLDVTDSGFINLGLIAALQECQELGDHPLLETAPGLNLLLCKQLMVRLGGSLNLQLLDDGRILSRFLIPNVTIVQV